MDIGVVGHVIAVILQRGGTKGEQPDRRDAEILEIIQFLGEPAKVADAVIDAVIKRPYMEFINDRLLVPQGVVLKLEALPVPAAHSKFGRGVQGLLESKRSARTCWIDR